MNTLRPFRTLLSLASVLLVGSSLAMAQMPSFRGSFNLPFDAAWGNAVLPAGQYTFTVDYRTSGVPGMVQIRSRGRTVASIMPAANEPARVEGSLLTLSQRSNRYFVRSLQLKEPGIVLIYHVPAARNTRLASNEPATTIPVMAAKR